MKRSDIIKELKEYDYKVDLKDSTCHLWAILCIYKSMSNCYCKQNKCNKPFVVTVNCNKHLTK